MFVVLVALLAQAPGTCGVVTSYWTRTATPGHCTISLVLKTAGDGGPVTVEADDATRRALPLKPWDYLGREVCVAGDVTTRPSGRYVTVTQASDIVAKELAATPFGEGAVSLCDAPVTQPRLLKEVKPRYTDGAMRARVQGVVGMDVVIDTDGAVRALRVTRPLYDELDAEAMRTVRQWVFAPGTLDGKPVRVVVEVEMTFTLRDRR